MSAASRLKIGTRIRQAWLQRMDSLSLDQMGMGLSFLCAIHCAVTPLIFIFIPFMVGKTSDSPVFHIILALLIIPIGLRAFMTGYRHHRRRRVFVLGLPGLFIVGVIPVIFANSLGPWVEPILMIFGSSLLITAHWYNRKSCSCKIHGGQGNG